MANEIKVGDIVYQKKKGWSGVPMRVVALAGESAFCKGAKGWGVNGLFSIKYRARVNHYHISQLTHKPNLKLPLDKS